MKRILLLSANYRILELCCFTNLFGTEYDVEAWDKRNKKDIFDIPDGYPGQFDLVCAAPPCDQFTKANAHHWESYPEKYINIASRCLDLCKQTGSKWFLENPPGRIEKFIPELTQYRSLTWNSPSSNKEYVIYSNFVILQCEPRYGKTPVKSFNNKTKKQREAWDPGLIETIKLFLQVKKFTLTAS